MGVNIFLPRAKSITRIAAGKRAQAGGERWQTLFHNCAIRQGFHCIRIPDGCKQAGKKLLRVQTPFDFVLSGKGARMAFIDTKSCKTKRFAASGKVAHQIRDLLALENHSHIAGYLVLFSTSGEVVFFSAYQLHAMIERSSLGPEDGKIIGLATGFDINKVFA